MSIKTEIDRIETARNDIATAISGKGDEVPEGAKIDDLPALINEIETDNGKPSIELNDESSVTVISDAANMYQSNSANVLWVEGNERCGLVGMLLDPSTLYFMKVSTHQIVKVDFSNDYIDVRYVRITGDSIQAVQTASEMDRILTVANAFDVGTFYMYLGETTTLNGQTYKNGAVYRLGEK